jgi:hypothetical protein
MNSQDLKNKLTDIKKKGVSDHPNAGCDVEACHIGRVEGNADHGEPGFVSSIGMVLVPHGSSSSRKRTISGEESYTFCCRVSAASLCLGMLAGRCHSTPFAGTS